MSNVSRNEMLVGVDIGTSKVVAIVAEARGGQLEIISFEILISIESIFASF